MEGEKDGAFGKLPGVRASRSLNQVVLSQHGAIHSDMMDVKNVCFLFHFPFLKSNRYHIEIPMRLRSTCYHNSIQKTNKPAPC